MIGVAIGDIVGSIYEWDNIKTKVFKFFDKDCFFTDDTVMTIAVAKALLECKGNYDDLEEKTIHYMQEIGRPYPRCGYGGHFYEWIYSDDPKPYNSFGNGSAMRIAPVGWVAKSEQEVKDLSLMVSEISHNHIEGIRGAEATAMCIYLALHGASKEKIKKYVEDNYYKLNFTLKDIRPKYKFDVTCQGSVPQAIECFLEGKDFEDVIRNAISIGGDSDTIAAIAGGIAEAYFGVKKSMRDEAMKYLDSRLTPILLEFEKEFGSKTIK